MLWAVHQNPQAPSARPPTQYGNESDYGEGCS